MPSPFHNLLNISMRRNKKAKQPVCGLCKLTFLDRTALHNHVRFSRRHLETFGCGLCNRPFLDQNDLELHTNAFHPSQSSAATGGAVVDPCAKTSKLMLSPDFLVDAIYSNLVGKRTSVYQSDPAAAPGIKSVSCKHCISTFRTEEEARNNHLLFQTHIFEPDDNVCPAWKLMEQEWFDLDEL
jgi:hypothetical protein